MTSGLAQADSRAATSNRFRSKPGDPRSLSAAGIMTIFEARNGQIWIGTHDGGANVLDPDTGLIRQLPYGLGSRARSAPPTSPRSRRIRAETSGSAPMAAASTWFAPDGTVVKVFRHDPERPDDPAGEHRVCDRGRRCGVAVWVGTDGGGLALVVGSAAAPDSIRFQVVSRDEGLSSDTIYGVLNDAAGRLWLSGNAGLMRFDPDSRAIKTFHREHGLQGEEFDFGAYSSIARRPAVLRWTGRLQHLRSVAPLGRAGVRRDSR